MFRAGRFEGGALAEMSALVEQLAPDGLMVLPLGPGPIKQELVRVRRSDHGHDVEPLIGVRFVPLMAGVEHDGEG